MNIILLSGGSGKRLWPLSNEVRSKQFLKIFRRADGSKESMAQRMHRMIKETDPSATITIATSANQIPQIKNQLGESVGISIEPDRRDTFPAIALAVSYLKSQGVDENEPVVVCPVDPYVESDYFECLMRLSEEAAKPDAANLTLMGIEPTYPSEKYGYIMPKDDNEVSEVDSFKEKPDWRTAAKYIEQGALWNGGVFAFKLCYVLNIAKELFGTDDYSTLYAKYSELPKISFDYAVVEKESSIKVVRFAGSWKDMGTWNTLSEAMDEDVTGNAVADGCENTHIMNELGLPMIVLGISNCVVAATPDGILVSDKDASPRLKDFVGAQRPMYERRGWGEYKVLDYKLHDNSSTNSLVKELILTPGQNISYQRHRRRTEVWTFTEGEGELLTDDKIRKVTRGDVAVIPAGMKHAIKAITELHIVEVQIGDELIEEDIERFEWNWE
ncbi:MAG: cupin domain-containing protein [Mogibacterium sp.]|nr:cupin domain-containing protein [Mogibacterium sp.]MBR2539718.1 cupin domain-containing protein [Mogibacterium sp.]